MRILSLFDGMACGMLAMLESGIPVDRYVAFEIDKYAIQTATHNFPMIEEKGDVFTADFTEFKGFDYLVGGSPCTYWSIAQKNNRETEASGMGWELFQQYVRALREAQPRFFIYENNKSMSSAIRQSITETFGFEPICINSSLVSAQNRQRLYWVGKRNFDGSYSKVNIALPEDRGILLKDILESGETDRKKGRAVITSAGRTTCREYFQKQQGNMVMEPCCMTYKRDETAKALRKDYDSGRIHHGFREHTELHPREDGKSNTLSSVLKDNLICEPLNTTKDGKASTVMAGYYKYGIATLLTNDGFKGSANAVAEPLNTTPDEKSQTIKAQYNKTSVVNICCYNSTYGASGVSEPVRAGCLPSPNGEVKNSQAMRVYSVDGKSVNLTSQGGGLGAKTGLYAIPVEWNGDVPLKAISAADGKVYTVYKVENGQITIKDKQYPIKLADGFYIIRKLTVRECMRLQTVPEWYEFPVSPTQAYKMLGNGWTVAVISHLINATKDDYEPPIYHFKQNGQMKFLI